MAVGVNRLLAGATASVFVLGVALAVTGATEATADPAPAPPLTKIARRPLPAELAPYEREASACPGLDPLLLVAIHDVETGRDHFGLTSTAGAEGPMQFLPETWAAYGFDGDGNGVADPWDIDDALAAATHLLCRNGVWNPDDRANAIWNYNHSWDYVDAVLLRADELRASIYAA